MGKQVDIIWARFVSGDKEAFRAIYDLYFPQLLAYGVGKLKDTQAAEDLVTDVFLKLLKLNNPGEIQQIENWLFTVTKNASLSYLTKQQRRSEILQQIFADREPGQSSYPHQLLDQETLDARLREKLKPDDQKLWDLHVEGYDNAEIAKRLSMNEKTVANRKTMLKTTVWEIIDELNREKKRP